MARSPTQLNINVQPAKEIRFSGDFREMVVQTLEIKNPGKDILYFKVKTTSPHRYVVKPHKGEIEGKGQVQIAVTLLPFLYKPDYSYRDKFLLQVCIKNPMNTEYLKKDFWSMVKSDERFEKKLLCFFDYKGVEFDTSGACFDADDEPLTPINHELVNKIVLGDEKMLQKKIDSAQSVITDLKSKEEELKTMNAKLKDQIDKRREQINENFNSTFPASRQVSSTKDTVDTAEIPMLYLVIMLSLTLFIGIALGGTLF